MNQKKVWNKIAQKWEEMRKVPFEQDLEFIKKQKGKMLDLGCGSGRNFYKKKDLEIYGIDFSKKMIGYAKESRIAKELKVMENEEIPYKNNFFDAAVCIAVLHCVETNKQREKMIKELFRVLKPKSEALITVWGKNEPRVKNRPQESFVPWTIGKRKYKRYTYLYKKEELENQLKKVGFEIVKSWENKNINVIVQKSS
ncbi:class I SAM-dependent methyltransferase [archaeon]|nr:class I SAM-dependent methyltransferase [archaeon]